MNLKSFRKVGGDEHHSVMQHDDGHQIKILHKPLSEKLKKGLMALPLAKGGVVDKDKGKSSGIPGGNGSPAMDPDKIGGDVTESGDPLYEGAKNLAKKAKEALGFADGGEVEETPDAEALGLPGPITVASDATPAMAPQIPNPTLAEAADSAYMAGIPASSPTVSAPAPVATTAPQMPVAASEMEAAAPTPTVAPTAPSDPWGAIASGNALQSGIGLGLQGNKDMAVAVAQQGAAEHAARQVAVKASQDLMAHNNAEINKLNTERTALLADIKDSHIDPNRYLGNMDTGAKIATGIGLLLSGFGAGLTHGENGAMKFLQSQIDRDIDAQKAELGKKENLLSANFKQFGNLRDATEMTRIQMNDILADKIGDAAAVAKGPEAKAAAELANGKIYTDNAQAIGNMAMRKSLGAASETGMPIAHQIQGLRMMGKDDMAKDLESRYVPGVVDANGKEVAARVPVAEALRGEIRAKTDLDKTANDLLSFIGKGKTLSLNDRNIAAQKAMALQSMYREGLLKTVYKQGEQPLLDKAVSENPLSFANRILGTEPAKIKEIINNNRRSANTIRDSVGLPQISEPAQYAIKDGVRYMKVPGGWAKAK